MEISSNLHPPPCGSKTAPVKWCYPPFARPTIIQRDRHIPLVEINVFEDELSEAQTQELIEEVTDVIVSFAGEPLREATWVVVQEVKSGNWGVGGQALGLDDIRAMQEA